MFAFIHYLFFFFFLLQDSKYPIQTIFYAYKLVILTRQNQRRTTREQLGIHWWNWRFPQHWVEMGILYTNIAGSILYYNV